MHRFDMKVALSILNLKPQQEYASGAQSIDPTTSLMWFSDPGTPAASNITLGKAAGYIVGDLLIVYNDCAAGTDVVLLAASIEDTNNITLADRHDLTVLMFNGSNWAHVAGTAPAP